MEKVSKEANNELTCFVVDWMRRNGQFKTTINATVYEGSENYVLTLLSDPWNMNQTQPQEN